MSSFCSKLSALAPPVSSRNEALSSPFLEKNDQKRKSRLSTFQPPPIHPEMNHSNGPFKDLSRNLPSPFP
jgi:hypothetical protein